MTASPFHLEAQFSAALISKKLNPLREPKLAAKQGYQDPSTHQSGLCRSAIYSLLILACWLAVYSVKIRHINWSIVKRSNIWSWTGTCWNWNKGQKVNSSRPKNNISHMDYFPRQIGHHPIHLQKAQHLQVCKLRLQTLQTSHRWMPSASDSSLQHTASNPKPHAGASNEFRPEISTCSHVARLAKIKESGQSGNGSFPHESAHKITSCDLSDLSIPSERMAHISSGTSSP